MRKNFSKLEIQRETGRKEERKEGRKDEWKNDRENERTKEAATAGRSGSSRPPSGARRRSGSRPALYFCGISAEFP